MSVRIYLYPFWVRLWHSVNAILFIVLIYSGISMQYASDRSSLVIPFERAVKVHNIAAVILAASYGLYVTGNLLTSNGKHYRLRSRGWFRDMKIQLRYYMYGMFRGEKEPFGISAEDKFNPLQRISYFIVIYILMPLLILSGVGLFFPEIITGKVSGLNSLLLTDLVHVISGFLLSVFMIIHIYTCTLGKDPRKTFSSIVTGFHEE